MREGRGGRGEDEGSKIDEMEMGGEGRDMDSEVGGLGCMGGLDLVVGLGAKGFWDGLVLGLGNTGLEKQGDGGFARYHGYGGADE